MLSALCRSLIGTLVLLGASLGAWASESAEGEADVVRVTLTAALAEADYPPFYYRDGEELVGFSIEVVRHVAKQLDIDVAYRRLSWPRVLQSLADGQVDMVTTFSNTAERASTVVYTGMPHAIERNHLFTINGEDIEFDGTLESLAPYRIGVIKGYTYGNDFDSADYLLKEYVLDEPTLVRMIYGKRFDLAVGNPFAIRLEASQFGSEDRLRFLEPPINRSPIYMAFSRRHPRAHQLAASFTREILKFRETDAYQRLLDKYELRGSGFDDVDD